MGSPCCDGGIEVKTKKRKQHLKQTQKKFLKAKNVAHWPDTLLRCSVPVLAGNVTLPQVSSSDPPTESGRESHLARMALRGPAEHPVTDPPGLGGLYQTPFGPLRQVSSCGTCVAWPKWRSTVQAWCNSGPALTAEGSHTPHMPHPSPLALAPARVTTPGFPQYLFPGFPQPTRTHMLTGHCPACSLLYLRGLAGPAHSLLGSCLQQC